MASIRLNKTEMYRVRVTAGGDVPDYPDITSTDTEILTTTQIILDSFISTLYAMFMTADTKYFYYNNHLNCFEYVRMALADIPEEVMMQYHQENLSIHGWISIEIRKGVTGLKQAGKVANNRLVDHLAKYGYAPCKITPALYRHSTIPVSLTLCVDDFGVKYAGKQRANHLLDALLSSYNITCDWTGSLYLGLTIY